VHQGCLTRECFGDRHQQHPAMQLSFWGGQYALPIEQQIARDRAPDSGEQAGWNFHSIGPCFLGRCKGKARFFREMFGQ